jgi:excisionase family DNA binding protein
MDRKDKACTITSAEHWDRSSFVSVKQVAERLGVGKSTIYDLIDCGKISVAMRLGTGKHPRIILDKDIIQQMIDKGFK